MARERDIDLVDGEDGEELSDEELDALAEDSRGVGGFLTGLVLGMLIGAGVALVLAPERGEVTRRRIRTRLRDIREDARDQLDDWREEAGREIRSQRRRVKRRLKGRS